ncbi:prepilin-type N-terminal cleavage/methylation domain-containing protein [bacterium]|jgi:prepilin-type N-terminal cleavage/methylation domain-containing protein|nr:prepilin-type N-terminal cleavage/methylation domain-containing protein [bacterium]
MNTHAIILEQYRKKGFTLIELILCLSIIGLMMSFIAPNFGNVLSNSKEQGVKAALRTIQISLENYYLSNETYPLGTDVHVSSIIEELKTAGAISKEIKNPFSGEAFSDTDTSGLITYSFVKNNQSYILEAKGINNESTILRVEQ